VSGLHELLSVESDKELAALAEEELQGLTQQVGPAAGQAAAMWWDETFEDKQ
jgi:hypothetical protein